METMLSAMYSRPDGSDGRESRTIYVADAETMTVRPFIGWSCAPRDPDSWWCPEYGYTVTISYGAFYTDSEARSWLTAKLREQRSKIDEALNRLAR